MGDFGRMVKVARQEQGVPYRHLAARICDRDIVKVTPTMLNSIEKGKLCSYDLAIAIALELRINLKKALAALRRDKDTAHSEREDRLLTEALVRTGALKMLNKKRTVED